MDGSILIKLGDTVENISELRDHHCTIIRDLKNQKSEDSRTSVLDRVEEVRKCLDQLDLNVEEGKLLLIIEEWTELIESEQARNELALVRMKDDNDVLRGRLEETENNLEDILSRIEELEVNKQHHLFMMQVVAIY